MKTHTHLNNGKGYDQILQKIWSTYCVPTHAPSATYSNFVHTCRIFCCAIIIFGGNQFKLRQFYAFIYVERHLRIPDEYEIISSMRNWKKIKKCVTFYVISSKCTNHATFNEVEQKSASINIENRENTIKLMRQRLG